MRPPLRPRRDDQIRRSALPDWNRLALEHPGAVSELLNATTDQHEAAIEAALASCGAPSRRTEPYAIEGSVVIERRRAVATGWACSDAPADQDAVCECVAAALPAELTVELERTPETFSYRGDLQLRM